MRRSWLIFASSLVCGCLAAAATSPEPILLWNASASAPMGLYYVGSSKRLVHGSFVVVRPDPVLGAYLARRHYLPVGVPLLKKIAALPGERVCRYNAIITINGEPVAVALSRDSKDRPLPSWFGCKHVGWNEVFLLNTAPDSLDGRYFGLTRRSQIVGSAHPLLTRVAPGQPLRWTRLHSPSSVHQPENEPNP